MSDSEFQSFPKMSRLSREIIVTEKLDGTNAQIYITEDGFFFVGSRNRWITPDDDNYGFARWCYANEESLRQLGPGRHHGEWWGQGIHRGYGLTEKRFSLFNTIRWCLAGDEPQLIPSGNPKAEPKYQDRLPACCSLVPVLYRGVFDYPWIEHTMSGLRTCGSEAAPGFMNPEGIVIFHTAGNIGFKKTLWNDSAKGA